MGFKMKNSLLRKVKKGAPMQANYAGLGKSVIDATESVYDKEVEKLWATSFEHGLKVLADKLKEIKEEKDDDDDDEEEEEEEEDQKVNK